MPSGQPTVQQLVYFLASVEQKSFAAAAQSLYIAQPSLSDQVKRLENTLGVVLFTRTNRTLQLTDAGRMLVPWAEKVLTDVRELSAAVRDVRQLAGGTVAFGTFSSAHLYLLPALAAEFHRLYPGVLIRVLGLNSAEVADADPGRRPRGRARPAPDRRSRPVGQRTRTHRHRRLCQRRSEPYRSAHDDRPVGGRAADPVRGPLG